MLTVNIFNIGEFQSKQGRYRYEALVNGKIKIAEGIELTDDEWALDQAEQTLLQDSEKFWLKCEGELLGSLKNYDFAGDLWSQHSFDTLRECIRVGALLGLAEGRRREREQIQKEVLPDWAKKRLLEREEAAAREMAEIVWEQVGDEDEESHADIWIEMWKQRRQK